MFVPVFFFGRAVQTVTDCVSKIETDGHMTHTTPINPKTHRNLANGEEGEGREGDLSSQRTVSFDS